VNGTDAVNMLRNSGMKIRKTETAERFGLIIEIYHDKYKVRGSIHKYFNDGLHNADDFTLENCQEALDIFWAEFGKNPEIIPFSGLEFGWCHK